MAAARCAYTTLDGAAVPARKRPAFADMAIARWAPFADPQSHVEWAGDRAMVWAWSRGQALAVDGPEAAPMPAPRRILPESLLRGQSRPDGQELVALDEGCEGRVWRDGLLAGARWWPQPPALPEWNQFLRGAGVAPASALPEATVYPLAERGWAAPQLRGGLGDLVGQQRNLLAALALAIAVAVPTALLVGVASLKASIWQVERDIATREQAIAAILDARQAAEADAAAVRQLLEDRPPAGQIELLAAVSGLMGGPFQILEWNLADARNLTMVARMPNADPRRIVTAWEGSGLFADVTAEVGRQAEEIQVKARIAPREGAAAPAPAAAGGRP